MALFILQGGTFLFQMNFGKLDITGDRKDRTNQRLSKNDKKKLKKKIEAHTEWIQETKEANQKNKK